MFTLPRNSDTKGVHFSNPYHELYELVILSRRGRDAKFLLAIPIRHLEALIRVAPTQKETT